MATANVNTAIWLYFVCIFLVSPIFSKKENILDTQISDKMIQSIMKRLGINDISELETQLGNTVDSGEEEEGNLALSIETTTTTAEPLLKKASCKVKEVNKETIIKATESIAAGAIFIDSIEKTPSNDECTKLCCANKTCDLSVYQDKVGTFKSIKCLTKS